MGSPRPNAHHATSHVGYPIVSCQAFQCVGRLERAISGGASLRIRRQLTTLFQARASPKSPLDVSVGTQQTPPGTLIYSGSLRWGSPFARRGQILDLENVGVTQIITLKTCNAFGWTSTTIWINLCLNLLRRRAMVWSYLREYKRDHFFFS